MGVTVETIAAGDGTNFPRPGQTVTVHYVGTLMDGSKFDSSRDSGEKFQFQIGLGQVIQVLAMAGASGKLRVACLAPRRSFYCLARPHTRGTHFLRAGTRAWLA